ncbi:MAG: hypothetical protein IKA47_06510 [Oscillospiraceae bacterium]|nr:hypothetical protein [Oscillospiraceae bacterium]
MALQKYQHSHPAVMSDIRYHKHPEKETAGKTAKPHPLQGARLPQDENSLLFIFVINMY